MEDASTSVEASKRLLATSLANAHALEKQAHAVMQQQVSRLDGVPGFKTRLEQHIAETEGQIRRLQEALGRLGEAPSTFKDASMEWLGMGQSFTQMFGPNKGLTAAIADQGLEGFEIASYVALIQLARTAGEDATAEAMEASLAEERAMFEWIVNNLPEIATKELLGAAG